MSRKTNIDPEPALSLTEYYHDRKTHLTKFKEHYLATVGFNFDYEQFKSIILNYFEGNKKYFAEESGSKSTLFQNFLASCIPKIGLAVMEENGQPAGTIYYHTFTAWNINEKTPYLLETLKVQLKRGDNLEVLIRNKKLCLFIDFCAFITGVQDVCQRRRTKCIEIEVTLDNSITECFLINYNVKNFDFNTGGNTLIEEVNDFKDNSPDILFINYEIRAERNIHEAYGIHNEKYPSVKFKFNQQNFIEKIMNTRWNDQSDETGPCEPKLGLVLIGVTNTFMSPVKYLEFNNKAALSGKDFDAEKNVWNAIYTITDADAMDDYQESRRNLSLCVFLEYCTSVNNSCEPTRTECYKISLSEKYKAIASKWIE